MTIEVQTSGGRTRVPGAITNAMRSVQPREGARIARIARVERGRIVDERLKRGDVRFSGGALLRSSRGYELEIDVGATARVATDHGAEMLTGPCRVRLTNDARGKIVCGDVAHLFQLVVEPPKLKAQLPISTIAQSEGVDWRFAIVVAISLLAHFGFASAAQADWFDPTIDEDRETAALITEARARPEVPVEEQKQPVVSDKTSEPTPTKVEPTTTKSEPTTAKGPVATAKPKASDDLSALGKTLDDLGLSTIGSIQKGGPAKSKLLNDPSAPDDALDELAKKKGGVDPDGPKMKGDPGSAGPIAPSDQKGIAFGDTKGDPKSAPTKPPSDEPKVAAKPNEPVISNPALPPDVNTVIAKNRWKLKACYTKELSQNSEATGTVTATVTISAEGDVVGTNVASNMSPTMNQCVTNVFAGMHFSPIDGKTSFKVPVIYTKPGS